MRDSSGATTIRLTGIVIDHGSCDRCGRELGRCYQCSDGGTYGRRCAALLTGYAASAIDRAARIAARCADLARRQAIVLAASPDLAGSDVLAEIRSNDGWWGGKGYSAYATWQDYAAAMRRKGLI